MRLELVDLSSTECRIVVNGSVSGAGAAGGVRVGAPADSFTFGGASIAGGAPPELTRPTA
jgi:hypothetical protein